MAQYNLTNLVDTTVTASTNYIMTTSGAAALQTAVTSASIAASGNIQILWNSEFNIPRQATWGTQSFTVKIQITTANSNVTAQAQIKNLATGTTTAASSAVACSATGQITLSVPSTAFSATSVTDRMQLILQFNNTNSMTAQTVGYGTNQALSFVTSSIAEFSDASGVIDSSGQYASDRVTAVAVGAQTGATDAVSTPFYLEADVSPYGNGYSTITNFEVETTSATYTNVASASTKSVKFKQGQLLTARRGACLTYDSINKRYLYLGGYDGTSRYNDLWSADASQSVTQQWQLQSPTGSGPAVFNLGASAQVNLNGKSWLIQYGGANSGGSPTSGLFICDCTTPGSEAWTTVTQTNSPGSMYYIIHHMVVVPTSSTAADVYLFGGATSASTFTNALWKISLNLASTVPTALTWTTVAANGASNAPTARDAAIVVYDATGGRIIVCAGYNNVTYFTDVTAYSIGGAAWSALTTSGATFTGRELGSGGWDATNRRIIVYGGWQGTQASNRNDIFQIDVSGSGTAVFTQIKANSTTNMDFVSFSSASTCLDTDKNILVTSGILSTDTTDKYNYAYDLSSSSGSTAGATLYGLNMQDQWRGRDAPAYVWNPDQSHMVLINGYSTIDDDSIANLGRGDHHQQIWTYNPSTNILRYANKGYLGMPHKEGVFAVYDTTGQRIICFGGLTGANQWSQEAWELKADANGNYQARHLAPSGTPPPARWLMAGCYDSANNRIIIWGGQGYSTVYATMYQLDLSSGDGTWSSLSPTGTAPTAVWQPAFYNDAANKKLYVHAGCTNTGDSTYSSQLFYVNYSTTTPSYTILTSTSGLAVRGATLCLDASNNLWSFGGYTGSVVDANTRWVTNAGGTWAQPSITTQPLARRSAGYAFDGTNMYMAAGRQVTGQFFSDVWKFVPNATPGNSTWTNQNPSVYQRMQVDVTANETFYFNATTQSDPGGVWTNDANAFDGLLTDSASTSTAGSGSSNYLSGTGTTAPSVGQTIGTVQVRVYGTENGSVTNPTLNAAVYYSGTLLGTATSNAGTGWSAYASLSAPSGGWTWAKVQGLELRIFQSGGSGSPAITVARAEILMTPASLGNDTGYQWQSFSTTSSINSNFNNFSGSTGTLHFLVGSILSVTVDPSNSVYVKPNLQIQVV